MPAANPVILDRNKLNRAFWAKRQLHFDERIKSPQAFNAIMSSWRAEVVRGVPVRSQLSLEGWLEEVENHGGVALHYQARKGGKAKTGDDLQRLIESLVKPDMKIAELLECLKALSGHGIIDEITSEDVAYIDPDPRSKIGAGRSKSVTIKALRSRLARAKKKVFAQ